MYQNKKPKKPFLLFLMALLILFPFSAENQALFASASGETAQSNITQPVTLKAKIDSLLKDEGLEGALTGVSVRNAKTGEILYSNLGNTRLHPASNMKLITAAAALEKLGTDYQFTTEIWTDGTVTGGVLQGNLYLKGKGDPTLLRNDLDQFAKDIKAKGIHKIKGDLIADDSWYDDVRYSQDLNWSDEFNYTGAQVSALTLSPNEDYDAGTVIVEASPAAKIGESAQVKLIPTTDYVAIVNKTETVGENEPKRISVTREHGTNKIIVEGTIPLNGSKSRSWIAVWEPAGYVLDIFNRSLQQNGVKLIGKSDKKMGVTPQNATFLTLKKSMPLKELLIPFMKLSNNGHAETLTKEMGKAVYGEGSWDKGLQVLEEWLADSGLNSSTIVLRDGSGMSHKTLIPANELTELLYSLQDKSWFPSFEDSLPVAGITDRLVGGTLRSRMTHQSTKGNVKAKTGSLTGVSTLSGYVTTQDGEKLIFSIMNNNHLSSSVSKVEDAIVIELAAHEFKK
ncbi:D-alanyl-D-alanine carboxypeptidase/D-alanyl-D-alanine-endopeptidase [Peribacillus saganii]|uniref:D-alanyl-D-alanine carboxypeptidase/D-alanyl-D-alanine-endopeptidase n=1 Tax=Peribacillus saganii TaxID=2303992 RepID=A0A372LPB7_9BACI|nr:D-alanyl-D-alanine carboxypeptidase/D-alanyl-D-alanine-endopeptidase [Peribacillus saganii]RFU68947.1 D-alanyl-D-alanine carboxypeptidase/D-alanyl-D-alanine-endopeptidase [Peribacillus saganii]